MRNAFANKITKISKNNKKIILLSGDIGNKLFDTLKSKIQTDLLIVGLQKLT